MASKFEETIRKSREERERKLKIIAPRFTPPPGSSFGRPTRRTSGGSGGGTSSRFSTAKSQAAAKAAKIIAEAKARQTKANKAAALKRAVQAAQAKLAAAQRRRALEIQSSLINKGATERIRNLRNKEGERIKTTSIEKDGIKIFTIRNLDTGEFTVKRFKGGHRVSETVSKNGAKFAKEEKPVTVKVDTKRTKLTPNQIIQINRSLSNESSGLNQNLNTAQLNTSINNDLQQGKITRQILNVADIISAGALTERKINNDQADLNNRIISFNQKFSGRELSEAEFKKAEVEQKFIDTEQNKINKRIDNLANSKRDSIRDYIAKTNLKTTPRLTVAEQNKIKQARLNDKKIQAKIKSNQSFISNKQSKIKSKNKEIKKLQSKKNRTVLQDIKLFRLKNQVSGLQTDIARLEFRAPTKVHAGTIALSGARIPNDISKISFIGAQKTGKGGKIVTDIIFRTKKGTMGVARGVSIVKKGKTTAVVAGRFGKVNVKLLTGKRKLTGIRSFVAAEGVKTKTVKFTSQRLKQIAKFAQQKQKKNVLRIIKTNIRGLQQSGIGRVATVKGKKFFHPFIRFPSGKISTKLGKGLDLDTFASISAVLTKKQLSAIIGKTITVKGGKAEFIGLIKSLKGGAKLGTLTTIQKQQYTQATKKLFSSIAAAVANAEKTSTATTKILKTAAAVAILSKAKPSIITVRAAKVRTKQRVISRTIKPTITSQTQLVAAKKKKRTLQKRRSLILEKQKTLTENITRQRKKVKQISKQKTRQKTRQKLNQRIAQLQNQKTRLITRQKLINKQILKVSTGITIPTVRVLRVPPIPKRKKKLKRKKKAIKKPVQVFNVFGKVKGKFIRLNIKPLTRKDALDKGAFAVDRTIARTFKIAPKGKSKKPGKLLKGERNYFNRQGFKLREVRIKKGRKFKLKQKYIEKSKFGIDTRGEKSGLTITRLLKQRRKVKRKITPTQRKKMLSNLKKARAVKKKLKGGKKK